MIQGHRIFRHSTHWASGLLYCVTLAGQPLSAAESGYPPPPGAYRSEPAAQMEPTRPSPRATSAGAGEREPTQSSSRQLPLPDDMFGAKRGRYDADNLFGSSTPVRQGAPEVLGRPDLDPAASTGPDQFAPLPLPPETMPGYQEFAVHPSPDKQPPPATRTFREHDGPAHPGNPSHGPGYSTDEPQYQRPYQPGAATGYAPAINSPGYVDQHGRGYPQKGGLIRETLPGAPLSAPPPSPGDHPVFRPSE